VILAGALVLIVYDLAAQPLAIVRVVHADTMSRQASIERGSSLTVIGDLILLEVLQGC
jgi:uncharacterized membrane protein YecN with MAPEG domain